MATMTHEQIDALEAGPEMDRLVAVALGLGDGWYPPECPTHGFEWEMGICCIPSPPQKPGWKLFISPPPFSQDTEVAVFAAELFADTHRLAIDISYRGYWTSDVFGEGLVRSGWAVDLTGKKTYVGSERHEPDLPLQISRAILKLHHGAKT